MMKSMIEIGRTMGIKSRQFLSLTKKFSTPSEATRGEQKLTEILKSSFPEASEVIVSDISGGCGAMFQINIESEAFRGKRIIQQHKLVTRALEEEIKDMHGLQITTRVPPVK